MSVNNKKIFSNDIRNKLKTVFLKEDAHIQDDLIKEFNIEQNEARRILNEYQFKLALIQNIRNRFNQIKVKENFKFESFSEFYFWYRNESKQCLYCGTKEEVLTYIFENNILSSKRGRGKVLEIERKNSTLNEYSKKNCTLACYLCNNSKSDIVSEKDYKKYFSKSMHSYLLKSYNICDEEKNHLYISDINSLSSDLQNQYRNFYDNFTKLLDDNDIEYGLLEGTKDIWCRDYMPIQINPKLFLTYDYNPDYLKDKKYWEIKTIFNQVNNTLNLKEIITTELVLDGGNVVKSKNCAILTDKIFKENPKYAEDEIIEELKTKLQVEKIVIIPWDEKHEYFGHADGMLRFIDEDTVLINAYFKEYPTTFKKKFFMALKDNDLDYKELIFDIPNKNNKLNWGYINYLEIQNKKSKNIIILPTFGIMEDKMAKEQFKKIFKNHKIVSINSSDLINEGGVLNCMTWSIYK